MEIRTAIYPSPIGNLLFTAEGESLISLDYTDAPVEDTSMPHGFIKECVEQVDAYFNNRLTNFSLQLNPEGTEFQKEVWNELVKIPFGETISYLELAERLGDKKKIRAAANANAVNKIAIIIPCHRVIGAAGELTGYAGGLCRKEWLLAHERNKRFRQKQLSFFNPD